MSMPMQRQGATRRPGRRASCPEPPGSRPFAHGPGGPPPAPPGPSTRGRGAGAGPLPPRSAARRSGSGGCGSGRGGQLGPSRRSRGVPAPAGATLPPPGAARQGHLPTALCQKAPSPRGGLAHPRRSAIAGAGPHAARVGAHAKAGAPAGGARPRPVAEERQRRAVGRAAPCRGAASSAPASSAEAGRRSASALRAWRPKSCRAARPVLPPRHMAWSACAA